MSSPFASIARQLIVKGISVIPIKPNDKRPGRYHNGKWIGLEKWTHFSEHLPEEKHIERWETYPDAGVGVLLGKTSGIIAIDYDEHPEIWRVVERFLPPSPCRKKGAKGYTAFYRYNGEVNDKWVNNHGETIIDLLSNGRQTVIPPSVHPSGKNYVWLPGCIPLDEVELEELPLLDADTLKKIDDTLLAHKVFSRRTRSQSSFLESTLPNHFDLDEATTAIAFIDPDVDNDSWVKIGMGLKEAFGEEGFILWDAWSSKGSKYKEGETQRRWVSFKGGNCTLRFMFKLAKEGGYKRKNSFVKDNLVEDADFESLWPEEDKIFMPELTEEQKKPTPSAASQEEIGKIVSIGTRRDVDIGEVLHALARIPEEAQPLELPSLLRPVFELVANSNGAHDEAVLEAISQAFPCVNYQTKRAYGKIIKELRKEYVGIRVKEEKAAEAAADDDEAHRATRAEFFAAYEKFFEDKSPVRDILSGDHLYYDKDTKTLQPSLNITGEIRSFLNVCEEGDPTTLYTRGEIEGHFEAWTKTFPLKLPVTLPAWDGEPRIDELIDRIVLKDSFTEQSGLTHEDFRAFVWDWYGQVWQKLKNPKVQNRLLLLVGGQGIGKDFWNDQLIGGFGQFVVKFTISSNEKDNREQLHNGVVMDISEFDRTAVMNSSTLKAMITDPSTHIRKSYDHRAQFRHVRCSFISSCNKPPYELLKDWTGNRRFLPFEVETIKRPRGDLPIADKLQVLAESLEKSKKKTKRAPADCEKKMAAYLEVLTPDSPASELLDSFDHQVRAVIQRVQSSGSLEEKDEVESWLKCKCGKYAGFIPKTAIVHYKIFEAIIQRSKHMERKLNMYLNAERSHRGADGKATGKWVNNKTQRGYYFLEVAEEDEVNQGVPF